MFEGGICTCSSRQISLSICQYNRITKSLIHFFQLELLEIKSIWNENIDRNDEDDQNENDGKIEQSIKIWKENFSLIEENCSLLKEKEEKKREIFPSINEIKCVEYPESFQSISTSLYLPSRFLLWNSIGAITSYNEQIQISFHDVSYHHTITIENQIEKYSLADLSLKAIILGSKQTGQCLCSLYQSWDTNQKQWIIKEDHLELVRLTDNYVLLATKQRFLRLFSLSGIQQCIIRLHGPIICLSTYSNQIWIIHHSIQGWN